MTIYTHRQVADQAGWDAFKAQYKDKEIVYELDEDNENQPAFCIDESYQETSIYAPKVAEVQGIVLNNLSVVARVSRFVVGVFLAIATLGISLCFEGGRSLFTAKRFATVVHKEFGESEMYQIVKDSTDFAIVLNGKVTNEKGQIAYMVNHSGHSSDGNLMYANLPLDAYDIRILYSHPRFKNAVEQVYPRSLFENAPRPKYLQEYVEKVIKAQNENDAGEGLRGSQEESLTTQ